MNESIPLLLQHLLEQELAPGEQIVWQARPSPSNRVMASATSFFFGIPCFSLAVTWTYAAAFHSAAAYFGLFWGSMFVAIGACLLLSPLWAWWLALHTLYVVTDRRALLIQALFRRSIRSFRGEGLLAVERRENADGYGDIIFGRLPFSGKGGRTYYEEIGFYGLADVRKIEEFLGAAYTKAPHT